MKKIEEQEQEQPISQEPEQPISQEQEQEQGGLGVASERIERAEHWLSRMETLTTGGALTCNYQRTNGQFHFTDRESAVSAGKLAAKLAKLQGLDTANGVARKVGPQDDPAKITSHVATVTLRNGKRVKFNVWQDVNSLTGEAIFKLTASITKAKKEAYQKFNPFATPAQF